MKSIKNILSTADLAKTIIQSPLALCPKLYVHDKNTP